MRVRIRPATEADVDAITAIALAAGELFRAVDDPVVARCADDEPYDEEDLVPYLDAGRGWVATWDADESDGPARGEVVGFVLVDVVDGCHHVEEVSVDPRAAGNGIGAQLIGHVVARAPSPKVTLTTFADVPWNRPYYERLGFVVIAEAERGPELVQRQRDEADHGLALDRRVAMARPVPSRPR